MISRSFDGNRVLNDASLAVEASRISPLSARTGRENDASADPERAHCPRVRFRGFVPIGNLRLYVDIHHERPLRHRGSAPRRAAQRVQVAERTVAAAERGGSSKRPGHRRSGSPESRRWRARIMCCCSQRIRRRTVPSADQPRGGVHGHGRGGARVARGRPRASARLKNDRGGDGRPAGRRSDDPADAHLGTSSSGGATGPCSSHISTSG
jgi:hypothetical protein